MAEKTNYCVIGAGNFGQAIIEELLVSNHSIMVIDNNRNVINKIAPKVTYAAIVNSENINQLKDAGILDAKHIFVCIGEDVKSSIMTCATLLQLGIDKKQITARTTSKQHELVLEKMGITDNVRPEIITGKQTAIRIVSAVQSEVIDVSNDMALVKINLTNKNFFGSRLKDLKLKKDFGIAVAAIIRKGKSIQVDENVIMEKNDQIILILNKKEIKKIESKFIKTS